MWLACQDPVSKHFHCCEENIFKSTPLHANGLSIRDRYKRQRSEFSQQTVAHYVNATAAHRILLLGGDISTNPGPCKDGTRVSVVNLHNNYLEEFAKAINPGSKNLNIAHINIRSLRNKLDEVRLLLTLCRFDVLSIAESHLDTTISNSQLAIKDYKLIRRDRGIVKAEVAVVWCTWLITYVHLAWDYWKPKKWRGYG